jgi:hypothetical protein
LSFPKKHPDRVRDQPGLPINGYRNSTSGVKQTGREVDLSTPYSAEIKKEWNYTSIPPIYLHGDSENLVSKVIFVCCGVGLNVKHPPMFSQSDSATETFYYFGTAHLILLKSSKQTSSSAFNNCLPMIWKG